MKCGYSIRVRLGKWLCYVLIICLFNTILDSPARFSIRHIQHGQVAINEIESIYEWLVEEVADMENAVPEQEDHNSDFDNFKKDKYDWAYQCNNIEPLPISVPEVSYAQTPDNHFPSHIIDNIYPPPEI